MQLNSLSEINFRIDQKSHQRKNNDFRTDSKT